MKYRFLALLLLFVMILSFSACTDGSPDNTPKDEQETVSTGGDSFTEQMVGSTQTDTSEDKQTSTDNTDSGNKTSGSATTQTKPSTDNITTEQTTQTQTDTTTSNTEADDTTASVTPDNDLSEEDDSSVQDSQEDISDAIETPVVPFE